MITDPVSRIAPPVVPGDRLTLRHRFGTGATDVIGWVEQLDATTITVGTADGRTVAIDRSAVLLARRVPAAAGGPDPARVPADRLQRIAAEGWADRVVPLGDWLLRAAGGFTRRANSALAVGDPGTALPEAAARVIDFAADHRVPPLAQVITGDPVDQGLRALGWTDGGPATALMITRLAPLLEHSRARDHSAPREGPDDAISTTVDDRPSADWLAALAHQRGLGPTELGPAALRVITGDGRATFATRTGPGGRLVAIGRGHLTGDWLAVAGVWTDPEHRRRGHATAVLLALARVAARRGARYALLQVERDNDAARAGYTRLGFRDHHDYGYLAPAGGTGGAGGPAQVR
ncbi:ribosomal protein S18 acetylase RimI-like enzyme [Friedmanniella endophytica]|uniref:Ribosomal protein S18 acetylase RimI-like enzyme n=1 Tax=Microlunatus kandeliicorticis TaxID=1759536 RepID=A0A7W3P631_9ACTN|nr:GNAT family N-acetyltransferase [Microlunatus kandeliicorticis]MBA8794505.1 ribosomal protein S18 acetylase RimI-like enzyme [Microlunatus kandeliicorticis]